MRFTLSHGPLRDRSIGPFPCGLVRRIQGWVFGEWARCCGLGWNIYVDTVRYCCLPNPGYFSPPTGNSLPWLAFGIVMRFNCLGLDVLLGDVVAWSKFTWIQRKRNLAAQWWPIPSYVRLDSCASSQWEWIWGTGLFSSSSVMRW